MQKMASFLGLAVGRGQDNLLALQGGVFFDFSFVVVASIELTGTLRNTT